MSTDFLALAFAIFLVFLNGFFVAAEFSLVKLRETRVKAIMRHHGWRGRMLARVHNQLDAYLSACQLGITLASLGLGWIGEPAFAHLLEPVFVWFGVADPNIVKGVSFAFAFLTISYLHIVVGELAPKTMAIRTAETVGLWTAPPLFAFYWLMFPLIYVLNASANQILRRTGLSDGTHSEGHFTADELRLVLRNSPDDGQFTEEEWRVLSKALDFRKLTVKDLMRPFNEAIVLHQEDGFEKSLQTIVTYRYSRYPLVDDDGKLVGVVYLKDVLVALQRGQQIDDLIRIARPAITATPEMPAIELFRKFQQGAPHFAVVSYVDGEPQGFITVDNLLNAIVGEIRDEHRRSHEDWIELDDGSLLGKGSLPLYTLERELGTDIPSERAETIAGLVLWKNGDFPTEGQTIEFEKFDVQVKRIKAGKISTVRVFPKTLDYAEGL